MKNNRKAGLAAIVGSAAAAILLTIIPAHEGTVLHAYQDPLGVWTACSGVTQGVVPGAVYTKEQCEAMDAAAMADHAAPLMECIPQLRGHPHATAAFIDTAYNVGVPTFCRSDTADLARAENWGEACPAIMTWCKQCYLKGIKKRRVDMTALCKMDFQ